MKTAKRKIYLTVAALAIIVLQCTMSVHAGGLEQSGESVSTTLYHEHTQADCWSRKWVPCGGWWSSYFEEYVGATVYVCTNGNSTDKSNGVVLSSIHPGWEYKAHSGLHDGEYVNQRTCDQSVAGTFTVTKILSETEEPDGEAGPAVLSASVTSQGTGVTDVSIRFRCPDQSVVEGDRVTVSQNGAYCAVLEWRDAKTGVSHTTELEYVEISNPVLLVFQSGGTVLDEIEVSYGDPLPEIRIPVKEGHDFKGYYVNFTEEEENGGENADAAVWYDEQGSPDSRVTVTGSALQETLTAKWEPRSYHVYYGEDKDGDGIGDCELFVTYGEEYGPVEITGEKQAGYVFDGYYLGKEQVFDADGRAAGTWRWDGEGDLILRAVYHKKPESSSGQGGRDDGGKEENAVPGMPDSVSDIAVSDNSLSANSLSGNSLSVNSLSGNQISGNGISENGISGNGPSDSGFAGGRLESGHGQTDAKPDGVRQEHGNNGPFHDRITAEHDSGVSDAASGDSGVTQEAVTQRISENMASGRVTEAGVLKGRAAVVRALEVTGMTAGILGLAYLAVWMVITKASFAELCSVRADETRRRLGAVLILHGENAFHIHIRDRLLEKGETGRYQVKFRKRFAVKHANQDIIIHCRKKEIAEVIGKDILFFTE